MIEIHGHRGSRGTHPENTIPSFAEAWEAGAAYVELDVHLTRDEQVVVFHDPEISAKLCQYADGRPIPAPIPIRELALADIKQFDCGSLTQAAYPEQRRLPGVQIPSLEELINWKAAHASSLRLNVEIKMGSAPPDRLARTVVSLLQRHNLLAETLIQSFDPEIVRAVRREAPEVRLSHLFERAADFARLAREAQAQVAAPNYLLITPETARSCQDAGIELLPWTVNSPLEWKRLLALGIQSIITDYPRKLAEFIKKP